MSTQGRRKVVVFGAGSYGTALAYVVAQNGHDVVILSRNPDTSEKINQLRRNPKYLKDANYVLPENLASTTDPVAALAGADYVVHTVPVQASRDYLANLRDVVPPTLPIISASKGIHCDTLEYMHDIIPNALHPNQPTAFLSGPSFAKELVENMPTAVVVASRDSELLQNVQSLLLSPRFRVYYTEDVIGVEVGGALKNIFAIGTGICEGLGLGLNTMAGVVTRGSSEMTRLALALGAQPQTMSGLSGMGDLMLTCFGSLSRNRSVGVRLGKGETMNEIRASMSEVAEGVATTSAAVRLAAKLALTLPLVETVAAIINGHLKAPEAVGRLMALPVGHEVSAELFAYMKSLHKKRPNVSFVIEKGSPEEYKAVIRMIGRSYIDDDLPFNAKVDLPDLLPGSTSYSDKATGSLWVVRTGNRLMGTVAVRADGDPSGGARITRLYVESEARGYGLGGRLLDTVVAWCRKRSIASVSIVSSNMFEHANAVFERHGFARTVSQKSESGCEEHVYTLNIAAD